jgi:hypothetical protein
MLIFSKMKFPLAHIIAISLVALMIAVCAPIVNAQTTLAAQLISRPVTNDDINNLKLPATVERSGGLNTVGLGQAAYLEADVDINVPASQIAGVKWTIESQPTGSKAMLEDSPLGSNVPVYLPSDRLIYQVAARKLFRPDVSGIYNISATITTSGSGVATLSMMITGSTYLGISACSQCHANGPAGTPFSMVNAWAKTGHSTIFTNNINGQGAQENGKPYPYTSACWGCHTVGYDTNATDPNGGFNQVMAQTGWVGPTNFVAGNFAAMPKALQNVSNIQCENCHGPGSNHVVTGGDPRLISTTYTAGACVQCHAEAPFHIKSMEWGNSAHAVTTTDPAGNAECVGCHTNNGFIDRINGVGPADLTYDAIGCQTCHEPHGETNPSSNLHLVRTLAAVTLADGTKVTTAGAGTLCMNCHQARVNAATYVATTPGSTYFGPHEGPQADMLMGTNGFTYGQDIPSSAHREVVADTCVACHTQAPASTDPALGQVGGHTFKMSFPGTSTIPAEQMIGACQTCHGSDITTFNFPLFDYDNTGGPILGVQDEVQGLLNDLAALLPPVGQAKSDITIDSTWTQQQLKAAYNYRFVQRDGSLGVHNTAYTVGLLKASIEDLQKSSK